MVYVSRLTFGVLATGLILSGPLALADAAATPPLFENYELIDRNTHEVDLDALARITAFSQSYQFNMADYVPLKGLQNNEGGTQVAKRISQQSLQHLLDDEKNRNGNGAVASVAQFNQKMKTQFGQNDAPVVMRLKPAEGKAEVIFTSGLPVKSVMSYNAFQNEAQFELSRDYYGKTLAYTHTHTATQERDLFAIRWGF